MRLRLGFSNIDNETREFLKELELLLKLASLDEQLFTGKNEANCLVQNIVHQLER